MSENDSDVGAFLAGFVIGGLVGAAAALILAPQSGEETRTQISAKGQEILASSEEQFAKASSAMTDARGRMQESGEQFQERARIVLDEGKNKISRSSAGEGEGNEPGGDTEIEGSDMTNGDTPA